jgi:RNA 3'-terminal phosphate cyclase-like protein
LSVESARTAVLPLYSQFGIFNNIELRILRRSNPGHNGKGGGGEVQLTFGHQVRLPKTLHLNPGRIKKVQGRLACRHPTTQGWSRPPEVSSIPSLTCTSSRTCHLSSAPLVRAPGKKTPSGKQKTGLGFGLSLVAESSTGFILCRCGLASCRGPAAGRCWEALRLSVT